MRPFIVGVSWCKMNSSWNILQVFFSINVFFMFEFYLNVYFQLSDGLLSDV